MTRHPVHLLIGSLLALAGLVFWLHHEIEAWPARAATLQQGSGKLRYVHVPKEGRHAAHWTAWLDQDGGGAVRLVCRDGAPCPLLALREELDGQRAQAGWHTRLAFMTERTEELYTLRVGEREVQRYEGRYYFGGRETWILRVLCLVMLVAGLSFLRARRG